MNLLEPETDEPEEDLVGPPPEVYGCVHCRLIFSFAVYSKSVTGDGARACPACKNDGVEFLGPAPFLIEDEEGHHLMDNEGGTIVGPFATQAEAQGSLWLWFEKEKLKHGNRESRRRQIQKGHIRLVSIEGVSLEEDEQEGLVKEDGKEEGGAKGDGEKTDKASGSKEKS